MTHLPRLLNAAVLPECLAKGVGRSLFGYALGDGEAKKFDTIHLGDKSAAGGHTSKHTTTASDCEIADSAWLLRPALAKSLMPEPEAKLPDDKKPQEVKDDDKKDEDDQWKEKKEVKIVEGERRHEQGPHCHDGAVGKLE